MLVADEPSPAAGAGVDGASALGASGFVSTVVAGFGVTGAVGCDAGASEVPALPLSPDAFPPLLVVCSDWCVF